MNRYRIRANVFFIFLMAVVFIQVVSGEGEAVSLLSLQKDKTMLIVPARPSVLQLAFDLAKIREITLVSFRGKVNADKPLFHVWTGSDWQYVSFDDFCSLRFVGEAPGTVIVIGDDQTVPKALLQGMSWAGKIERLPTMNAADLINGMNPYFKFNSREWKQLADSYGLKLKGANASQSKQLQEANTFGQKKRETSPAVPVVKSTAAFSDNEVSRSKARGISSEPSDLSADLSGVALAKTEAIRAKGEARNAVSPCGDPQGLAYSAVVKPLATKAGLAKEGQISDAVKQKPDNKLHLHLGDDEYILFVWITPLSIWVGQYEVTNAQYGRFNRAHDPKRYYDHILNLPDQPAVLVSWEDANNYCGWLNRNFHSQLPPGFEFRLPTEKEWTAFTACGREVKYPWGDQWPPPDSLNYKGTEGTGIFYGLVHNEKFIRNHNDGFIVAAPVGKSGTNEWGLYGVGGNVWEWCQDWFDDTKTTRVLRGAAWNNYEPAILAISNRSDALPEKSNAMIGFRVVVAPQVKMQN